MPSENLFFQRVPAYAIPPSNHSPEWMPLRASSPGSDVRIRRQSRPYWVTDLSGLLLDERTKDIIVAMLWRNGGMVRPVLNYIPLFCEIGVISDRDFNGDPIVTPQVIGECDGTEQTFQLKKRLLVPGYESEEIFYNVTKPHHDYPVMHGLVPTIGGQVEWNPMPLLTIYIDGEVLASSEWTVDRNTGLVTLSTEGEVSASGGFYVLQLMPSKIGMQQEGSLYRVESGVTLIEPCGGR